MHEHAIAEWLVVVPRQDKVLTDRKTTNETLAQSIFGNVSNAHFMAPSDNYVDNKTGATFVTPVSELLINNCWLMVSNHQVIEPSMIPAWIASS